MSTPGTTRLAAARFAGPPRLATITLWAVAVTACGAEEPVAVVAADRSAHLFDRPFPSDELLTDRGTVDLRALPEAGPPLGADFMAGWKRQVREAVFGFSPVMPVYLRFTAPVEVAPRYDGAADDPVRLYSLDSGHRVAVRTRVIADDLGDPYLPRGLLIVAPDERDPLRPGERYAAVVTTEIAAPADGYRPPAALADVADLAVGTVFTVQDPARELRALGQATDALLDERPELLVPIEPLREVASVRYEQGLTPSERPATLEIVTFVDGDTEVTYLDDKASATDRTIDVTGGPYRVLQAAIRTATFQDPEGRPYQSRGIGFVNDHRRSDGWLHFDAAGAILDEPWAERMRVVVQVPRAPGPDRVVVTWGHGSGGDAYEAISRVNQDDRIDEIRGVLAGAGAVVVSADMPLFGQRFDLIDAGYSSDQAFINVGNLPVFRDNPRQAAVDHHVLYRFAAEALPGLLAELDGTALVPGAIGMFGHSTGSQVAALVPVLQDGDGHRAVLLSGAGGYLGHYIIATDLIAIGGDVAALLFRAAGVDPPDPVTPQALLGALFGVAEPGWTRIDRHHPLALPFQMILDGADPLSAAPAQPVPARVFLGEGDRRTPNDSTRWIADAMPAGELVPCVPAGEYDGHYCALRESAMHEVFRDFVDELREAP